MTLVPATQVPFGQPTKAAYPGADYLPDVNETAVPFVAPPSGGFLYSVNGVLTWRSSTGETPISAQTGFPVVNVKNYGAKGDGVANDTAAIVAALAAAHATAAILYFPPGTYLTDPISLTAGNCPVGILGANSTVKARAASASPLLTLANLHTFVQGFFIRDLILAAYNRHASPLTINGGEFYVFTNVNAQGGVSNGIVLNGAAGAGIYYCTFTSVISQSNHGGSAWKLVSTGGLNYINSNTFVMCTALNNTGVGLTIDYAGSCYIGFEFENNSGGAVSIDHTADASFFGGYSENNNSPDSSFVLTANSTGVKIVGGRHNGTISGTLTGAGNVIMPTTLTPQMAALTLTGLLTTVASASGGAGLNIPDGVAPTSPNEGDVWQDGTNVKIRIGGATKTFTLT